MKKLVQLIALLTISGLFAGCATSGYQKAGNVASNVEKAADSIAKGSEQIDLTLAALTDLVNNPQPDLKPQFKKFSSDVNAVEAFAKNVAGRAKNMSTLGTNYFATWEAEIAKIQNEDIRKRSTERKEAVMKHFEKVKVDYNEAKTAFIPFMNDLKDIRTALSTDLTTAGITSIKGVAEKTNKNAVSVRQSLAKLVADFKELSSSLAAATPQPATPAK